MMFVPAGNAVVIPAFRWPRVRRLSSPWHPEAAGRPGGKPSLGAQLPLLGNDWKWLNLVTSQFSMAIYIYIHIPKRLVFCLFLDSLDSCQGLNTLQPRWPVEFCGRLILQHPWISFDGWRCHWEVGIVSVVGSRTFYSHPKSLTHQMLHINKHQHLYTRAILNWLWYSVYPGIDTCPKTNPLVGPIVLELKRQPPFWRILCSSGFEKKGRTSKFWFSRVNMSVE